MNMKMPTEFFPSDYALVMAHHVGLCVADSREQYDRMDTIPIFNNNNERADMNKARFECNQLRTFQQMSIASTLERALMAAYPREHKDLTEEQLTVLKMIYDLSKDWATGHITDKLLESIEVGQDKDKPAIADVLMAIMNGQTLDEASKGKGKAKGTIKQFYMELTEDD